MIAIRFAQASVNAAATTRLPIVAGWDSLLLAWFTRLDEKHKTPRNSILFVGAVTFVPSTLGLVGVGKQEAFQLLWNSARTPRMGRKGRKKAASSKELRILDLSPAPHDQRIDGHVE